jgi:putative FmdB family regulatory protein
MPIFEYLCEDCGTKFEKLMRNGARASFQDGIQENDVLCPSCGEKHVERQISTFAAHAHGSSKESAMPMCPGGMCQTPDLCGRN